MLRSWWAVWGCCCCDGQAGAWRPRLCRNRGSPQTLVHFLYFPFFFCALQFKWGLRHSREDCAAHLHISGYSDGHTGEPAGDGGGVPGQATQVSPCSPHSSPFSQGAWGKAPDESPLHESWSIDHEGGATISCGAVSCCHLSLGVPALRSALWPWDHCSLHPLHI